MWPLGSPGSWPTAQGQTPLSLQHLVSNGWYHQRQGQQTLCAGPIAQQDQEPRLELLLNLLFFGNNRLSSGHSLSLAWKRVGVGFRVGVRLCVGTSELLQEQHLFLVFSPVPNKLRAAGSPG